MFQFVQQLLGPRPHPIGVDFGTDCLRLAQVQEVDGEHKLIAAASAEVPLDIRRDPQGRLEFFSEALREMLAHGQFRGRYAVLCLPAWAMHIQQIRVRRMNDEALRKVLPQECRGKLPLDPEDSILRYVIAGSVERAIEQRMEVIVMAAARQWVDDFINAAVKAKLEVVGMNVEPIALLDCFNHVYRRTVDREATTCYADIGSSGTRVTVARGEHMLFTRTIPIGGDQMTRLVAAALGLGLDEAKTLRIKLAAAEEADFMPELQPVTADVAQESYPTPEGQKPERRKGSGDSHAGLPATAILSEPEPSGLVAAGLAEHAQVVREACRTSLDQLAGELDLCRRYCEGTFPETRFDRLIFLGGEARQRSMCHYIGRAMGLVAHLGDPMCRMARLSEVGIESGIDRRQPQPGWSVAIGLTLGSKNPVNAG